jgi:hypothetical protein
MNKAPKIKTLVKRSPERHTNPYGEGRGRQLNPIEEKMMKEFLIVKYKCKK